METINAIVPTYLSIVITCSPSIESDAAGEAYELSRAPQTFGT